MYIIASALSWSWEFSSSLVERPVLRKWGTQAVDKFVGIVKRKERRWSFNVRGCNGRQGG